MSEIVLKSRMNKMRAYIKNKISALHLDNVVNCIRNPKKIDVWSYSKDETKYVNIFEKFPIFPPRDFCLKNRICLMISEESSVFNAATKAKEFFRNNVGLIDPLKTKWTIEQIKCEYDGVIFRPLFHTNFQRQFSNEQLELLLLSGIPVWPNRTENYLYEAKRQSALYLKAKNIPMPQTDVYYDRDLALKSLDTLKYPIIMKTNVGASSSGVFLIKSKKEAFKTIKYVFSNGLMRKGANFLDIETGYILLQEFLENVREYRIIKIGRSWFGHEKKGRNGSIFFSGSGENSWNIPPDNAFDFCFEIAIKNDLNIMAFDVFETPNGTLLLNEAQTWFGSYNPSQMYYNGKPGRYVRDPDGWRFEEGIFNYNQSLNLRIYEFDSYLTNANHNKLNVKI